MSPRQMLRAYEVRSPERPKRLGQRTDRQVRQYPDAAGAEPTDATLEDHLDITASRIRLNAGSLDWRQGGSGASGAGQQPEVIGEQPFGDQDGANLSFVTASQFVPQSLQVFINGLRQAVNQDGTQDITVGESGGLGTGFDTINTAFALLQNDRILCDYVRDAIPAP
jgi:hypothetical protein